MISTHGERPVLPLIRMNMNYLRNLLSNFNYVGPCLNTLLYDYNLSILLDLGDKTHTNRTSDESKSPRENMVLPLDD